jgi:predicted nucleic acid-binding protein
MDDAAAERVITDFLAEEYVVLLQIDPFVTRIARQLVRWFRVAGKDAIHVASALRFGARVFETFDQPLMRKLRAPDPGGVLSTLTVREPTYDGQARMF